MESNINRGTTNETTFYSRFIDTLFKYTICIIKDGINIGPLNKLYSFIFWK